MRGIMESLCCAKRQMIFPKLFPDFDITEANRLYVVGNGFDIHHGIESRYIDFKDWLQKKKHDSLVRMMDVFFSNKREFWGDIEKALGEYDEKSITDYCEPESSQDEILDHPGRWQAGVEDSIPYVFGVAMGDFREAFNGWVENIDIDGIEADLQMPQQSKYLSFNYTETLEKAYGISTQNILHIHGSRLDKDAVFEIGHGNSRDANDPYGDEGQLLPYQNAYSSVIGIMNEWKKDCKGIIERNQYFFNSLISVNEVCTIGISYNDIDLPYLKAVASNVALDCKWVMNYYSERDKKNAQRVAGMLGISNYVINRFE